MSIFPSIDVENKVKEVEGFAKITGLSYLYIYSSDESVDGDVIYSCYDGYLESFAYRLQENELRFVCDYIIYIDGRKFVSKNMGV